MAVYNLQFARVFTGNLPRALLFYTDILGLNVLDQNIEKAYAIFDTGAAKLILEESDDQRLIGRFTGISLTVKDVEAIYNQLVRHNVRFSSSPVKQFWGGYLANFHDLDENILTLSGQ